MKQEICLSYMVVTPEVPADPFITGMQGDLDENIAYLSSLGYDGVEFMTIEPEGIDPDALLQTCKKHHIRPTMVCTGELYGTLGLSFSNKDETVAGRAVEKVRYCIDLASRLNTKINIGRVRGMTGGDKALLEKEVRIFREICGYAAARNVDVLLEPLEPADLDFITSLDEAEQFRNRVGCANFMLMMDICAMFSEELPHTALIRKYAHVTEHIHLTEADRWFPGHCNDFEEIIAAGKEAGYKGPYSVEILPYPDQREAAKASIEHLAPIMERIYHWKRNNENGGEI